MNEEQKPKRAKRRFDEGFRRQAVALVETSGRPLREIAQELDVSVWNLRDWISVYGQRSTPAQLEEQLQRLRAELAEVRDQRDALKKIIGHPCRTVPERFTQMKTLETDYRITTLCAAFAVSRAGYYRWRAPKVHRRVGEDARLKAEIQQLHLESRGTYGRPRLLAGLRHRGGNAPRPGGWRG